MKRVYFEGHQTGCEHRTTGARAWCTTCAEWCYAARLCARCEVWLQEQPAVQAQLRQQAAAAVADALDPLDARTPADALRVVDALLDAGFRLVKS